MVCTSTWCGECLSQRDEFVWRSMLALFGFERDMTTTLVAPLEPLGNVNYVSFFISVSAICDTGAARSSADRAPKGPSTMPRPRTGRKSTTITCKNLASSQESWLSSHPQRPFQNSCATRFWQPNRHRQVVLTVAVPGQLETFSACFRDPLRELSLGAAVRLGSHHCFRLLWLLCTVVEGSGEGHCEPLVPKPGAEASLSAPRRERQKCLNPSACSRGSHVPVSMAPQHKSTPDSCLCGVLTQKRRTP